MVEEAEDRDSSYLPTHAHFAGTMVWVRAVGRVLEPVVFEAARKRWVGTTRPTGYGLRLLFLLQNFELIIRHFHLHDSNFPRTNIANYFLALLSYIYSEQY